MGKLISIVLLLISSTGAVAQADTSLRYRGAVFVHIHRHGKGYGSELAKRMYPHLKKVGYNSVQLNTFAYMTSINDRKLVSDKDGTLTDANVEKEIRRLRDIGFSVMLKPHVWVGDWKFDPGNWRNAIDFGDKSARKQWFESYGRFIKKQAEIAERSGADIFVVGTELKKLTKYEEEWISLISEVRHIFTGKLTYAAEGWNARNISFWNYLDYIGIDAYFSLSQKAGPTVDEIVRAWEPYTLSFKMLSKKFGKKIIFTEFGYKSVKGATIKPWQWPEKGTVSQLEQRNAFRAARQVFTDASYLAGVYVWKYFTSLDNYEKGNYTLGFSPYKKEAEDEISQWFSNGINR